MSMFFAFGTIAAGLSAAALLFPQSPLDRLWRLNPEARIGLESMSPWGIVLMAVVSAACALCAYGVWTRAVWGRQAAILLVAVNLIGDTANAIVRGDVRTLIGLPIGGALIAYLHSRRVRAEFGPRGAAQRS